MFMKINQGIVFVLCDLKNKKLLMEKRTNKQVFSGIKVFPGGKIEDGEENDFAKTLVREIFEELRVVPKVYFKIVSDDEPIIGEKRYT